MGRQVRDLRRRLGLSVEQLADRCTAAGVPLTPGALYLIEGGGRGKTGSRARRRVTLEEWLALAWALDVSPLTLLLPRENVSYQVTPTLSAQAIQVGRWLTGVRRLHAANPELHPGVAADQDRRFQAELPPYLPAAYIPEDDDDRLRRLLAEVVQNAAKPDSPVANSQADEAAPRPKNA